MSSDADTTSTEEDFIDSTEVDKATQNQNRSNIVGSSSYDAQFTADNLEARGLPPENFMSAENFAQTRQGGAGGDDTTSTPEDFIDSTGISVPSIQAADTTSTFGQSANIFDPDLATMTGRRDTAPRGLETGVVTPEARGIPSFDAFGNPVTLQSFAPANVTKTNLESPSTQAAIAATLSQLDQARDRKVGLGDKRGIDFGVTQQLLPATTPTARPENLRQRFDNAAIQEALEAGTLAENLDRSNITEEIDDLADTEFAIPGGTGTTATRTTATGAFDPEAENLMDSTFLDTTPYKEGTAVADIKLRDAPFNENLNLFGLQIPNLAGRALNFGAEKLNDRLFDRIVKKPSGEVLRDKDGRIIGVMDPTNSFLIEGMPGLDSKGQMRGQMQDTGDGGDQPQRRVAPKAATDPCPEGYQLIDGKCTPVETDDKGTGFITFPPDRDPPFRTGPFTPTTIATDPTKIKPLVPITFGLSNIFRR